MAFLRTAETAEQKLLVYQGLIKEENNMSNGCSTMITLNGNKKNIANFVELLEKWTDKDYLDVGQKNWLGYILIGSGIATKEDIDKGRSPKCRGELSFTSMVEHDDDPNEAELTIYTYTAWVPMLGMWLRLIDKYLPKTELIYSAEEPGCGIFVTNDPVLEGQRVDENPDSDEYDCYYVYENEWRWD